MQPDVDQDGWAEISQDVRGPSSRTVSPFCSGLRLPGGQERDNLPGHPLSPPHTVNRCFTLVCGPHAPGL